MNYVSFAIPYRPFSSFLTTRINAKGQKLKIANNSKFCLYLEF